MPKKCLWDPNRILLILIVMMSAGTVSLADAGPSPGIETSWLSSLFGGTEIPPTGENLGKAADDGNLEDVKDLVARGADISYSYGYPLTAAARNGHTEVVKYLLEAGANPNRTNERGYYVGDAISQAAGNNHLDIINLLLEAGATVKTEKYTSGIMDRAAENGHLEAVQMLLEAGADPNHGDGYSLLLPAKEGHLDIVKAYIEAGADVNTGDGWIIKNAAEAGHLEVVRTLIEAGAKKEYLGYALARAASNGHLEIMKLLLEKGADISKGDGLMSAAEYGDVEGVRLLLEAGYNTTIQGETGSPLHSAAKGGHPNVIALMVEYGADINMALTKDIWRDLASPNTGSYGHGWTVTHTAARFGHPMTQELLELGADINIQDAKGRTPLQVAILYESLFVAKDLLRFCADSMPTNEDGKSTLDLAKEVALRNASGTTKYQVLMNTLKEVMKDKIATTPSNEASWNALGKEFKAILDANSTLKDRLKDVETSYTDVWSSVNFLFQERARRGMVKVIEGHGCKTFTAEQVVVTLGTEYLATCNCVPGQGPKMTFIPIQEAHLTECVSEPPLQEEE